VAALPAQPVAGWVGRFRAFREQGFDRPEGPGGRLFVSCKQAFPSLVSGKILPLVFILKIDHIINIVYYWIA
jgi:hypothetical protein